MRYDENERRKLNELLSMGSISSDGRLNGQYNLTLASLMNDNSEPGVTFAQPQFQQGEMDRNREQFAREDVRAMERGFNPEQFRSPQPAPQAPEPQNYFQRSGGPKISLDQFAGNRPHDVFRDGPLELGRQRTPDGGEMIIKRVPGMDSFGRQSAQVVREFVPPPDYGRMKQQAEIERLQSETEKNRRGEGGKDPEKVALYKMYQGMPDGADKDAFGRMIGAEGKDAKGKALPSPAVTKLAGMADAVESTERAVQGFKPEYGGKLVLGRLSNTIGKLAGDDTGQVQWWQDFDTAQNQARHALFGSALTATEKAAWEEISINPRMDSREIQKNLARRQQLEANAASKLARAYAAGGYNKDQIGELLGASADYLETPAAPAGGTKAKGGNHGPIVRTVRLKNGKTGIEYADGTRVTQ